MSNYTITVNDGTMTVVINGRYTFENSREVCHDMHLKAMDSDEITHVIVDLNNVQYIDSAGLGSLLDIRRIPTSPDQMDVVSINPDIVRAMQLMNFDQLFNINK